MFIFLNNFVFIALKVKAKTLLSNISNFKY